MVRINLIDPRKLTDQHLIAEYVEIKMLISFMEKYPNGNIPIEYTLNKGHMSFFRNKGIFVFDRFLLVIEELMMRKIKLDEKNIEEVFSRLLNLSEDQNEDYIPTIKAVKLSKQRILERVKNPIRMTKPHTYYKKPITIQEYKEIIR